MEKPCYISDCMSVDTSLMPTGRVYEALARRIRTSIRESGMGMGAMVGTEQDLARKEGVSRMTVRRASELLINEGLLERRPGKGLYVRTPSTSTKSIQVVVGNLLWEPCLQMSRGVQAAARGVGLHVQIYDAHGDADLDLALVDQLPNSGAKGAVIAALHGPRFCDAICRLHASGFPFVILDQRMRDIQVPSVTADNHGGGHQIGKMLLDLGHRRIAFIGDLIASSVQERLEGLRDAIWDAGLPFSRNLIVDLLCGVDRFGDWSSFTADGVKRLMALPVDQRPTAIFCSCDSIAAHTYTALAEMGLSIPGDVSVVGFDDDAIAAQLRPGLTSARQPFLEMGQVAMDILEQRLRQPTGPAERRIMPVELVHRQSVAPPPAEARVVPVAEG